MVALCHPLLQIATIKSTPPPPLHPKAPSFYPKLLALSKLIYGLFSKFIFSSTKKIKLKTSNMDKVGREGFQNIHKNQAAILDEI